MQTPSTTENDYASAFPNSRKVFDDMTVSTTSGPIHLQIGRASCRERV